MGRRSWCRLSSPSTGYFSSPSSGTDMLLRLVDGKSSFWSSPSEDISSRRCRLGSEGIMVNDRWLSDAESAISTFAVFEYRKLGATTSSPSAAVQRRKGMVSSSWRLRRLHGLSLQPPQNKIRPDRFHESLRGNAANGFPRDLLCGLRVLGASLSFRRSFVEMHTIYCTAIPWIDLFFRRKNCERQNDPFFPECRCRMQLFSCGMPRTHANASLASTKATATSQWCRLKP